MNATGRQDSGTHPAFEPFEPLRSALLDRMRAAPGSGAWLALVNRVAAERGIRTATGMDLQFVRAGSLPHHAARCSITAAGGPVAPALDYERRIHDTGRVACRTDGPGESHDLHNALVWLHWPRTKRELNRQHVLSSNRESSTANSRNRSRWRDGLTLLDESGVIWVERMRWHPGQGPSPASIASDKVEQSPQTWSDLLRRRDWSALLIDYREQLRQALMPGNGVPDLTVRVIGHGLLEKWQRPYKSLTAHALVLASSCSLERTGCPMTASDQLDLDARVAHALREAWDLAHVSESGPILAASSDRISLWPLPMSGLPGWFGGNDDPGFLNDPSVFRPHGAVQS